MKKWVLIILGFAALVAIGFFSRPSLEIKDNDENFPPLQKIELAQKTVSFDDSSQAVFNLAVPFEIAVAAENLGKARFIAKSPDNRIFIPDMVNFNYNTQGRIIILDDFNKETMRFETRSIYLSNLKNPNSIEFYEDKNGQTWIYIALTDRLIRYPYKNGDNAPSIDPEVIARFPDYRSVENDVWHITRTIAFHNDELYVSIGSSCNVCEDPQNEIRSMIMAMNPDGSGARTYASGLRNAVGIAFADNKMYATVNGVDHLGINAPDDLMHQIIENENYGFPYCYESNGTVKEETSLSWNREPVPCDEVPVSLSSFGAHAAPLGITYFKKAHSLLQESFLVALHGSFQIGIGNGYEITRVTKDGAQETFMDGFLLKNGTRSGRPVHVFQNDENSFFFTDDFNGRLYYVYAR